ncbi:translation initiation factor IF-2-like isoform X2, partial [Homo sapiens]|uniref:translation initiation factor IF-2-like isoform X2 n=1 Tax=Homo sapiens TaxID=9606 RepID=UPI001FB056EB
MRGLDQMEIRGGPYLLLGEVVGHSALGAQPAQAADEVLELPALLQRPAGRRPCASHRGRRITPATALLLLSHRGRAERRSMQAAAAKAGSPGRRRVGKGPPSRESWTRSAPQRCPSQDAGRAGSRVCRSRPQSRGGQKAAASGAKRRGVGGKEPRRQKPAAAGAKSRGGKSHKKPRRRGQKAAPAKNSGGGGNKPQKAAAAGAKNRGGGGGKKPR